MVPKWASQTRQPSCWHAAQEADTVFGLHQMLSLCNALSLWLPACVCLHVSASCSTNETDSLESSVVLLLCNHHTALQVYGFDILLDSDYQASLIEVNTGPDLASNTPLDRVIKYQMVSDLLHLVGVQPYDRWAACLWKCVWP